MKIKLSYAMIVSNKSFVDALIDHFNYSMADVTCYEELTSAEKQLISEEVFNLMTE